MKFLSKIYLISFLITSPVFAVEYNVPMLGVLAPGADDRYQQQVGLDGIENIRLRNGLVNHVYNEITIPGPAGFDLNIYRYYSSPQKNGTSSRYSGGRSVMGIGWDIHMGRIMNADYTRSGNGCQADSQYFQNNPILELSNGERHHFYNAKPSFGHSFISETMWAMDCTPEGMLVHAPNGTKYYFNEYAYVKLNERPVFNVTSIEDKNGNLQTITYQDVDAWNALNDDGSPFVAQLRAVSSIVTSETITVDFQYQGNKLSAISYLGKTWSFEYLDEASSAYNQDFYLERVRGPEGYTWEYQYNRPDSFSWVEDSEAVWESYPGLFSLSEVTTPRGAVVNYYYQVFPTDMWLYYSGLRSNVLNRKEITWPGKASPIVWTYRYTLNPRVYDAGTGTYSFQPADPAFDTYLAGISEPEKLDHEYVLVEGPDKIELVGFCSLYIQSQSPWKEQCPSMTGEALRQRTFNLQDELIQEYAVSKVYWPGFLTDQVALDNSPRYINRTVQASLFREGEHYNTLYTDFDAYLNPMQITEFTGSPLSDAELSVAGNIEIPDLDSRNWKEVIFTFYDNTSKWIIGELESRQTSDVVDSSGVERLPEIFREFDVNGNIEREHNHSAVTSYTYFTNGDLNTETDPLNKQVIYTSYKAGIPQLEQHVSAGSTLKTISRVVSDEGNITSVTNGRQKVTSYTYDDLNRVKTITYPRLSTNGEVLTYQWTQLPHYQRQRGAYVETVNYDPLGQVVFWNKGGVATHYEYDDLGRLTFQSYPNDTLGTMLAYDEFSRLTRLTHTADNSFIQYDYEDDNRVRETNERNNEILRSYRSFGNPNQKDLLRIQQKDTVNNESVITLIERSIRGDVMQIHQGKIGGVADYVADYDFYVNTGVLLELQQRWYKYDQNYNLDQFHFPETGLNLIPNDDLGNRISRHVDANYYPSTGFTSYLYDDLHRLDTIDYPDPTLDVVYTYDDNDNVSTLTRGGIVTTYDYDDNDNLQAETLTIDGQDYRIEYRYDANDALSQIEYPDGLVIDYAPNALGQPVHVVGYTYNALNQLEQETVYVSNVIYHPDGSINTLTYGNGHVVTMDQNPRQLLESILASNGSEVVNLGFEYDAKGNIETITDDVSPSHSLALGYDALERLITANGVWGNGSVTYDSHGNIKSKIMGSNSLTYTYSNGNNGTGSLLQTVSGSVLRGFQYDQYKNVRFITYTPNRYHYDDASNLDVVTKHSGSHDWGFYRYDGNGYRVSINEDSSQGQYHNADVLVSSQRYSMYDSNGLLAYEFDESKQIVSDYIRIGRYLVAQRDDELDCPILDSDSDQIPDCVEFRNGINPAIADDADGDRDEDGRTNLQEYQDGTDMNDPDTDGDGMSDGVEHGFGLDPLVASQTTDDFDGDGIPDLEEYQLSLTLYPDINPGLSDSDGDGLDDLYEISHSLIPDDEDTDNDGITDGYEVDNELLADDPGDAGLDKDEDGFSNIDEFNAQSLANDVDSIPPGNLKWSYPVDGTITGPPAIGANGDIFVTTTTGWIYALRPSSGVYPAQADLLWSERYLTQISMGSRPVIGVDDTVFIKGYKNEWESYVLEALSPETGEEKWYWEEFSPFIGNPVIGIDGTVYYGTRWQEIPGWTLNAVTPWGITGFSYHVNGPEMKGSPVVGENGYIYFINSLGQLKVIEDTHDGSYILHNTIYSGYSLLADDQPVISENGTIYYLSGGVQSRIIKTIVDNPVPSTEIGYLNPQTVGPLLMDYGDGYGVMLSAEFGSTLRMNLAVGYQTKGYIGFDNAIKGYVIGADNIVYVTDKEGGLYAVRGYPYVSSPASYSVDWSYLPGGSSSSETTPMIGAGGDIYYGTDNILRAVSANTTLSVTGWPVSGGDQKHSSNACRSSDIDSDGDLIPDCVEEFYGLDSENGLDAGDDEDGDGLTNLQEYQFHSNPNEEDTDNDDVMDMAEYLLGFSPISHDSDFDLEYDYEEYLAIQMLRDGDANGDNEFNVADLMLLQRHVQGYALLTPAQIAHVDVYPALAPDGILNLQDVLILSKMLIATP